MGVPGSANPMLLAGGAAAYEIDQSLRFNSADSAYLSRTASGFGITTTCTISWWHKKAAGSTSNSHWTLGTYPDIWSFESTDSSSNGFRWLNKGGTITGPSGSKYRDYSGWYHWLITNNGSASKVYLNGTLIVSTTTSGSSATGWYIGSETGTGNFLNGYMAEFHFLDGIAVTDATSFGETDTTTGAWIPKKYTGTYGTNGFYLKFDPTATNGIGHDHSGNGNNFTATGFTTSGTGTDVMSDTPTTNYATMNPVDVRVSYIPTYVEGSLQITHRASTGQYSFAAGTFAFNSDTTSGWYFEATATDYVASSYLSVGLLDTDSYTVSKLDPDAPLGASTNSNSGIGFESTSGYLRNYGTTVSGWDSANGTDWTTDGDIIMVAVKNNKIYFGKNGTWLKSANPSTESTPAITLGSAKKFIAATAGQGSAKITFNFGQRAFAYTPPTGYKALNTANLPEPTIKDGGKYFNTVLWTGTGGSGQSITGVGFQPDLVWIKDRTVGYDHVLQDVVRGTGEEKKLYSSRTDSEASAYKVYGNVSSFDTNGFTVANGSSGDQHVNQNTYPYVAWNWKAGGTGSSNTAGSITSTVSANPSAGFSIVTYTGNGSTGTIGHGLGVAPKFMIVKSRNNTFSWSIYHTSLGNTKWLDFSAGTGYTGAAWNSTDPTSTVFSVGNDAGSNNNTTTYVAYCFSEVAGYSKAGKWSGNSSTDGPFVFLGFKPSFLLWKAYDTNTEYWWMQDLARNTYNVTGTSLAPSGSLVEQSGTAYYVDFLSNGFKMRSSHPLVNSSSYNYLYFAFAELPFKYANAR